jgi:hypothetical protein
MHDAFFIWVDFVSMDRFVCVKTKLILRNKSKNDAQWEVGWIKMIKV